MIYNYYFYCGNLNNKVDKTILDDIGHGLPRDEKYYHNGQYVRLTAIGYDGSAPYLIIDGNKHHFALAD